MESRLGGKGLSLAETELLHNKRSPENHLPSPVTTMLNILNPKLITIITVFSQGSVMNQVFMDTTSQLLLRSLHTQNSYPPASRQSQSFNCEMLLFFSPPFKKGILDTEPITCCMKVQLPCGDIIFCSVPQHGPVPHPSVS